MILETDADKSLFEELYKKYKARMYKYAYSILHNKEDAEDVVHQAFLTIANIPLYFLTSAVIFIEKLLNNSSKYGIIIIEIFILCQSLKC